ncbi:MAG TPA: DnaJ domain-containing protein [Pyrinomonadaceae bacterium]|nr:DnaJ domain-containing protein [Pyrinomonadaceae bacterium]
MRDGGREGCLRVLGLGPTASAQEIKAAYRDLAKVWHPDRFSHDPRLQQKAQEQLKEINEAYRRLAAGDYAAPHEWPRRAPQAAYEPRAADAPPSSPRSDAPHDGRREAPASAADERVATRPPRRVNRVAIAAPALAFCATFAFVTPRLLSTGRAPEQPGDAGAITARARDGHGEPSSQPTSSGAETAETKDASARQKSQTTTRQLSTQAADSAANSPATQPVRAMPTVTVSVDPTTGLRARPSCPNKSPMTFPAGDEPGAYCDAAHKAGATPHSTADGERAGKMDESRLKSVAGRLASPAKRLFGGRRAPDREPAGGGTPAPRN